MDETQKFNKEFYILQICQNIIKKLQKLIMSLSMMRTLPKRSDSFSENKKHYETYMINSIRRKVMKDLFHQVKEYFSKNLQYLIARVVEQFNKQLKQFKSQNSIKTDKTQGHFQSGFGSGNTPRTNLKIQVKHYKELIDDLKVLYGINDQFLTENCDPSIGFRLKISKNMYDNMINYNVSSKQMRQIKTHIKFLMNQSQTKKKNREKKHKYNKTFD